MLARRLVASLMAIGAALVALAVVAGEVTGTPMVVLFKDASVAAKELRDGGPTTYAGSFYLGAVSTLTIAVWSAVASLSAFVAWWWKDALAATFAVLVAVMGTDDALLLHESVGPSLGVPDLVWPAIYGGVSAVLLWRLVRARATGPAVALVVGLALLAESVAIDVLDELVLHLTAGWLIVVEDGSKLVGALVWLAVPVLLHVHHDHLAGGTRALSGAARSRGARAGPARAPARGARSTRG